MSQYEFDIRAQQEEASTSRAQVQKLKCDITMKGLEFSRLENALRDELRSERKSSAKLRQKLNAKLLEAVELESKLVPQREKIVDLEGDGRGPCTTFHERQEPSQERLDPSQASNTKLGASKIKLGASKTKPRASRTRRLGSSYEWKRAY